ncbi:MAG: fibronectin type III domain-containing protein [Treponema sp.]|nr:fibronectin type III domain-containing protein [Treponema sp.]
MNKQSYRFLKNTILVLEGALLFLLCSCDNFLNGPDLKKKIENEIAYASAPSYILYVEPPESRGVIRSPSGGEAVKKISDTFRIYFEPFNDYEFVYWKIIDKVTKKEIQNNTYISLDNPYEAETECSCIKIPDSAIQLCLIPILAERPQIISHSPMTSGIIKDAGIQVLFDHDMDSESIYFNEEEIEKLLQSGIKKGDFLPPIPEDTADPPLNHYGYTKEGEAFFKNISIKNNNDGSNINSCFGAPVFENLRQLSIPVYSKDSLKDFTSVLVTIEKGFFYTLDETKKHIEMPGSKKWLYQVSDQTDTNPLIIARIENNDDISITTGNGELEPQSPLLSLEANTEKIKDFKFLKNSPLSIHLKVQEPVTGSGPSSKFTLHARKCFDENYIFQEKYSEKTIDLEYDSTTSDVGVFNKEVDLSDLGLDDGVYQLYFEFTDKSGNKALYPSDPNDLQYYYENYLNHVKDGENPDLISELEYQLGKYKCYYFAVDNKIDMETPIITDTSDSSGAKFTLSLKPCIDFDRAEIQYSKDWSETETLERGTNSIEFTDLALNTTYTFKVTCYDYAGNSIVFDIEQTSSSWAVSVRTESELKNVYLQNEDFDPTGIIVTFHDLNAQTQRALVYNDDWTTDFNTEELTFDRTVEVSVTYNGQTKTAEITVLYYVAREDALTLEPVEQGGKYLFGDFPQTLSYYKDDSCQNFENERNKGLTAEPVYNGWYLSREDGYFYAKYSGETPQDYNVIYSTDGITSYSFPLETYHFFKVEPVSWVVINDNYNSGKKLLISEKILSTCQYYDYDKTEPRTIDDVQINQNDYQTSRIYAYLNGLTYTNKFGGRECEKTEFKGKGFLQLAFRESKYIYNGKLNLLSTNQVDGQQKDFLRAYTTDYALAGGLNIQDKPYSSETGYICSWWLQTKGEDSDIVYIYYPYGEDSGDFKTAPVNATGIGVRPVLILN